MEHSLPSLPTIPWRTATIVASAIAAVELVLLLVLTIVLLTNSVGERVRDSAAAAAPSTAKPRKANPSGKPRLARSETSVVVLNGNGRTGAAAEAADRLRSMNYGIGSVGNAPRANDGASVVMYRPGYRPEALRLARDMRLRLVSPLDGIRLDEMLGAHVAIVLGTN